MFSPPQHGLELGYTLFLMFISDMPDTLSRIGTYADGTTSYTNICTVYA